MWVRSICSSHCRTSLNGELSECRERVRWNTWEKFRCVECGGTGLTNFEMFEAYEKASWVSWKRVDSL